MSKSALTGSRIRERRLAMSLRQADLARMVEISASYLNLIEHNRRRIGGKLLLNIATTLEVELTALTEGAEAQLVANLDAAAAKAQTAVAETDRTEDFAGRFPGWATLTAEQDARIDALERTVAGLSDRMTHDPFLSASLHEMLSTVTAIRSTSSILAGEEAIEPEWQDRFHQNLFDEARRLSEASAALVRYFDTSGGEGETLASPQEELEAFLVARGFHLPELEAGSGDLGALVDGAAELTSSPSRQVALDYLQRFQSDAVALPLVVFRRAVSSFGIDPLPLAQHFGVGLSQVLRRIASLPPSDKYPAVGIVMCDGSGTLTFRRPLDGFPLPRFGAACPLWPLYSALSQPEMPIKRRVVQAGPARATFDAYALAERKGFVEFDAPPIFESTMLLVPTQVDGAVRATEIGVSCRICPRTPCLARREPSILADGF